MSQLRLPIRQVRVPISCTRFKDVLWGVKCNFKIEEVYGIGVINEAAARKIAEGICLPNPKG